MTVPAAQSRATAPPSGTHAVRPARIGVYELLAEIGQGTSAAVYLARSPKGDLVAVKVLKREESSHPEARERFAREALITSRIEHHGIVRALDAGEDHGLPYIVMDYVAGASLAARIASGPLAVPEATRMLAKVARAMHAAHAAGVVHRDLKPANILLDRAGNPRVSDFGLARDQYAGRNLTRDGDVIGTPYYMSPEQVHGEQATAATDVWGLGVVLYECVTGKRPFEGHSVAQVAKAVLGSNPVPPSRAARQSVMPALDLLCAAALSKDPERRPSMEGFARDLEALAAGDFDPRRPRRSGARPLFVIAAGALGFALGAGMVALRAPRAPAPVDTRPLVAKLDSVAAAASVLRAGLDRALADKAALERRIADVEVAGRGQPDVRDLLRVLGDERLAAARTVPLVVDRSLRDLEALPVTNATLALRARLLNHRARYRETVALLRVNADRDDPELQRLYGEALLATRDESGRAVLRRVIEQDPDGARGLYLRARSVSIRTAEDFGAALALFEKALALDPGFGDSAAEKAFLLAQPVLRSPKEYDPAIAAANRAIAIDPTAPRAWFARSFVTWNALCYRADRGEPIPDALVASTCSDLRVAFALSPDWEYLVYTGKTYVVAGRPLEGLPELTFAVDSIPRGEPVRTFALAWRGNAKMAAGDEAGAVDDWLAALAAGPREIANQCAHAAAKVTDETRRRRLEEAGLELPRPR